MHEREVQNYLDKLDGNLFLDKHWDRDYSRVVYVISSMVDGQPYPALEWRDWSRRPLGLDESRNGLSILQSLHQQEGDIQERLKETVIANALKKEKIRSEAIKESAEIAHEFEHEKRGKKSVWLPKMKIYNNLDA